jgi:membrane protease YdiL (CAAX protease family)
MPTDRPEPDALDAAPSANLSPDRDASPGPDAGLGREPSPDASPGPDPNPSPSPDASPGPDAGPSPSESPRLDAGSSGPARSAGQPAGGSQPPWQSPPAGGWQRPPAGAWLPTPRWAGPPQAGYLPPAYPGTLAVAQASWPIGWVPWGYTNPPPVPPVLEPPGNFHPPASRRSLLSLAGRVSPRLHVLGLTVGLPGMALLLLYFVGVAAGLKLDLGPLPVWLALELVGLAASVGLVGWAVEQGRQRRADRWQDYAGPSPLLTVAAFLAITTAFEIPLELVLKAASIDLNSAPATLAEFLVYLAAYFGLVYFLAVRKGALTWHDIANPERLAPSPDDWTAAEPYPGWVRARIYGLRSRLPGGRTGNILIPLALVLPIIVASNVLSAALLLALGLSPSDINPTAVTPTGELDRLLTLLTVAVLVPIGEELFFRGFATNAWGRSLSRNSAIIRAALFFAFIHVINTATTDASVSWRVAVFNFGARIPVAFALTWLYMRRRSLLATGTLHAGYNGLITLISFS